MKMSSFNNINKPHTPEWSRFNDNSKSKGFRAAFIKKYGGEFKHNGKWHQWVSPEKIELEPIHTLIHPNQEQIYFTEKTEIQKEEINSQVNPLDSFKNKLTKNSSGANRKRLYIITNPKGKEIIVDNFSKFCKENKLNKSAMYEVMRGKRNHHKKYTCKKKEY